MSRPIIEVTNVSKRYRLGQFNAQSLREEAQELFRRIWRKPGAVHAPHVRAGGSDFWALKDISFSVQPGEVVGIIGRNGAGKSTLLKILSRVTEPTEGEIRIRGCVASLLEVGTGFHPELTGRENIYLNGTILGMTKVEVQRKFDEIVAFAEIDRFLDTPVKRYSSGMYVRLAFAVAAHLEPDVLIVDEVLAVGDAEFQKKCLGKMQDVSGKEGRTVLFVSHNMSAIRELCSRAILLESGRIKRDDAAGKVVEEYFSAAAPAADIDLGAAQQLGPQVWSRLHRLQLFDGTETPTATILMSQVLIARIRVEITRPAKQVEVGLKISSRYGAAVHYFTSSWEGLAPDLEPGHYWFEVKVPSLLLFPGTYLIGVWVLKSSEWSDVHVQDVGSIVVLKSNITVRPNRMEQYVVSGGEVYSPSEWRLVADASQEQRA